MKPFKIVFLALAFVGGLGYFGNEWPDDRRADNFDLAIDQLPSYDVAIDYAINGSDLNIGSALHAPIFVLGTVKGYPHKPQYSDVAPQFKGTIAKSRGPPYRSAKIYSKDLRA